MTRPVGSPGEVGRAFAGGTECRKEGRAGKDLRWNGADTTPLSTMVAKRRFPPAGDPLSRKPREWDPDLWLYRDRTMGLLKRYMRLSVEVGRLPSLLGREFFRAKISFYTVCTFEDVVIFVHDMERCLEKLDEFDQKLIATVVFRGYPQDEAANRLKCWRRTVSRRFPEAIDRMSEILLECGLLIPFPGTGSNPANSCQEGKVSEVSVSGCEQSTNNCTGDVPLSP